MVAFVATAAATAFGTTAQATLGAAPSSGDLLVAFVTTNGGLVLIDDSSGWHRVTQTLEDIGSGPYGAAILYKVCGAGESATQTPATVPSATTITCQILRYNAVGNTTPFDIADAFPATDPSVKSSPTVTPTQGVQILIVGAVHNANPANAYSGEKVNGSTSGVTERNDNGYACMFDRIVTTSSGSYDVSADLSIGSSDGSGHIIIFVTTSGGGSGGGGGPEPTGDNICEITDGTDTFSFYDYTQANLADGGHDFGVPGDEDRTIKLNARLMTNDAQKLTLIDLEYNKGVLLKLLDKAKRLNDIGLPRQVILRIKPFGLDVETVYFIKSGNIPAIPPWNSQYLVNHIYDNVPLILSVEPWGYGPETPIVTTGTLYSRASIDARFTVTGATGTGVDGTVQGVNVAALSRGSLTQKDKLTLTPTLQAVASNVAYLFGCTFAQFTQLMFGIKTPKTGSHSGVWEYWSGSAWAGVTTVSTMRSGAEGTEFDTAIKQGVITFVGTMTGWVTKAIGGVTAYWVRYRIPTFSSGVAPIFYNGPVRSMTGVVAVIPTAIPGDAEAAAMVHVTNPSATALAGVKIAVSNGELSVLPPPFHHDLAGADLYVGSSDITLAIASDANADNGERIEVTLAATIVERAQTLNGTTEYITLTPTSSDKLATLGNGSFFIEALIYPTAIGKGPIPIDSQWTSTTGRSYWFGIDGGKLYGMIVGGGGKKKAVAGSTVIPVNEYSLVTMEWNSDTNELSVLRDSNVEKSTLNVTSVANGFTTPIRIGHSSGFATGDTPSGLAEGYFQGYISNVRHVGVKLSDEHPDGYNWPLLGSRITQDSANTRWLLKMEDNAGNTTIVDSAVTFAAAKNAARSAANTSARTLAGYFQPGVGQSVKVIGSNLQPILAEEFRGRAKFYLRAAPATTLTSIDDVIFQLQLSVGDVLLPLGPPGRFPSTAVPSGGYYMVDLGPFPLPPTGLRDSGFGDALTSAENVMQAYIFIKHNFLTPTVVRLDRLDILPTTQWLGEYSSFEVGQDYDANYDIDQNTGVLFDSLGSETIITQTTTVGYTEPFRNPYGDPGGAYRCRLAARQACWIYAIPLRGINSSPDYLQHNLSDSFTLRLHAAGLFDALAR